MKTSQELVAEVRKTIAELGRVIAMLITIWGLAGLEDERKGKAGPLEMWAIQMANYQAVRAKKELLFWNFSIQDKWDILRSPSAAISSLEKWGKVVNQLMPGHFLEEYKVGDRKGDLKIINYLGKSIPLWGQITRALEVEEARKWMK